ncbi:MAG: hypothetical protein WDA21_03050 [Bacilli bacterium]
MKNNKGFTVYELLISFTFLALISYSMLSMILNIKDKSYLTGLEFDMKTFKNAVSIKIENDLTTKTIQSITTCGDYCISILYDNEEAKQFSIDISNKTISYGTENYKLPTDSYFGESMSVSTQTIAEVSSGRKNSLLIFYIPIEHYEAKGDFGLNLIYQYDNNEYDLSGFTFGVVE